MKLIHLSDLHLGKRVNEYSMLEDQEYILKKLINIIDDEKPKGVIFAGDIYDKSIPSAEEGDFFGFFGPNGAGKSTTIRTLPGLVHPTAGEARVPGRVALRAIV